MSNKTFLTCTLKREIAITRNNKGSTPQEQKLRREKIKLLEKRLNRIVPPHYNEPCVYCGYNNPNNLTLHDELDENFQKTDKKIVVCEHHHDEIHRLVKIVRSDRQPEYKKSLAKVGLKMLENQRVTRTLT